MNYKLNNKDISEFGVLPCRGDGGIALSGMFDLPKRTGITEYNWGDRIEPYVGDGDLAYGSRTIGLKLVMPDLADLSRFREAWLDCKLLTTELGSFRVVAAEGIRVEKVGEKAGILEVNFLESEPEFPALTLKGSGGKGFRLDDYHLEHDLGIYVASVKDRWNLPKRIEVGTTSPYPESRYREKESLTLECVMRASNLRAIVGRMGQLHALCVCPGLRVLHFPDGTSRQVYVKEGFKVNVLSEGAVGFHVVMS